MKKRTLLFTLYLKPSITKLHILSRFFPQKNFTHSKNRELCASFILIISCWAYVYRGLIQCRHFKSTKKAQHCLLKWYGKKQYCLKSSQNVPTVLKVYKGTGNCLKHIAVLLTYRKAKGIKALNIYEASKHNNCYFRCRIARDYHFKCFKKSWLFWLFVRILETIAHKQALINLAYGGISIEIKPVDFNMFT